MVLYKQNLIKITGSNPMIALVRGNLADDGVAGESGNFSGHSLKWR